MTHGAVEHPCGAPNDTVFAQRLLLPEKLAITSPAT